MSASYVLGDELGDLAIAWYDRNGDLIDFSTGWTFSVKVGQVGSAALFTKSSGITGAATDPNVTVAWATSGELNSLSAGVYTFQIAATRVADSKVRTRQGEIRITGAVT